MFKKLLSLLSVAIALGTIPAQADTLRVPVLVPITGFLSLEGKSQRNGALLAFDSAPLGVAAKPEVFDTATSPEVAVNAMERALSQGGVVAMVAPMLGTQMLALLPLAEEYQVPLLTVSGTAKITEMGNPWVFRFFPGDAVVKTAQARYVVEELAAKRPALITQTTAYGQSGRSHLSEKLSAAGAPPVFDEAIAVTVKDMLPVFTKAMAAEPDVLVLHLHSGPTALLIRQARSMGITLPIVAGSAMHQPATAALLEPPELAGVCAESGSSPISARTEQIAAFNVRYRAKFGADPDAFALGQFDATSMMLGALAAGADTPDKMRDALSTARFAGLAMTYRSDGKGNMAHDAVILCYDGRSRVPKVVKRYVNVSNVD